MLTKILFVVSIFVAAVCKYFLLKKIPQNSLGKLLKLNIFLTNQIDKVLSYNTITFMWTNWIKYKERFSL